MISVYVFVIVMWLLILVGGGIMVVLVEPLSLNIGNTLHSILNPGIKVVITLFLISIWIFVLIKIKNWFFQKWIKN